MTFSGNRTVATLVSFVVFAVFAPSLGHDFLNWDDDQLVVENAGIRRLDAEGVVTMFTSYCVGNYTPLERLSLALDHRVWGLNPWGFHFTNNLLHALDAALLFLVASRILSMAFGDRASPAVIRASAAVAALAFALHPLRVESVVWISERRDVLALFFLLLCVLCHWESVVSRSPARQSLARMAAWTLFMASLLSKASGVTLPVVLLLLDVYPLRRLGCGAGGKEGQAGTLALQAPAAAPGLLRCVWEKAPFFALSLFFGLVAIRGQTGRGTMLPLDLYPWASRVANSFASIVFYVEKWILPVHLCPIYPSASHQASPLAWPWIGCAVWVVLVTGFVTWRARRCAAPAVAWWSYLVMILPFTGLLQAGAQGAADRYTLLATIPFAVLLGAGFAWCWNALGLGEWGTSRAGAERGWCGAGLVARAGIAGSLALLVAWAGLSVGQAMRWKDSPVFWEWVLTHNPHGFNPLNSRGVAYMADGQPCPARVMFREVTRWNPRWAVGWRNLASADILTRRGDQAVASFERALALDRGRGEIFGDAHSALADLAMKQGGHARARHHLFLALQDGHTPARLTNLGLALEGTGQTRLALKYIARAAQQGDVTAFRAGAAILENRGRLDEALAWLRHGYEQTRARELLEAQPALLRKKEESERRRVTPPSSRR